MIESADVNSVTDKLLKGIGSLLKGNWNVDDDDDDELKNMTRTNATELILRMYAFAINGYITSTVIIQVWTTVLVLYCSSGAKVGFLKLFVLTQI